MSNIISIKSCCKISSTVFLAVVSGNPSSGVNYLANINKPQLHQWIRSRGQLNNHNQRYKVDLKTKTARRLISNKLISRSCSGLNNTSVLCVHDRLASFSTKSSKSVQLQQHLVSKCNGSEKLSENVPEQEKLGETVESLQTLNSGEGDPQLSNVMRVLNVAEKNDAAKRISGIMSKGTAQTRPTFSRFNKSYEFNFNFQGQPCEMFFTSVSGHLLGAEFGSDYKNWQRCDPVELFDAPIEKRCLPDYMDIKRTLESLAPRAQVLVIWTDCDREGEGIGFEIISVCTAINPRLQIYRAKFSEMTPTAVNRAWSTLGRPDKRLSDAVDVRSELDLRIGAAFTRFQTLRLQRKFPHLLSDRVISYGSCQFPTLGFVVERYKAIQDFIPEDFWKIEVNHKIDNCSVDFNWARVRLFNKMAVHVLLEKCLDSPQATVTKAQSKPKNKWRPVALDTVEFEKLSSRKLKINAKEAMKIAEKLYTQGIISYPRTETNIFPQGLDLRPLIEAQTASNQWGEFATRLFYDGPNPRNGRNTDQAHPPIHPTRFDANLTGNDAKVYELIVRHFLACCSKDALGKETTVEIEIAEEKFVTHGLIILERNYLEVYPYDRWSDKELPDYHVGQTFRPTKIEMVESQTSPPALLTEADLIALMEKHGIGTDATHAEHIETVKKRMYVGVQANGTFVPGQLGMGLVEGYDAMGFAMSKPHLRSELEADLKRICEGTKNPAVVLAEQIRKYKEVFIQASDQVIRLDETVGRFLNHSANNDPPANAPRNNPGHGGSGASRQGGNNQDDDDDDNRGPPPAGGGIRTGNSSDGYTTTVRNQQYSSSSRGGGSSNSNQPSRTNRPPPVSTFDDEETEIICPCGQVQPTKIVQKSANKGRPYKRCDECGFFKWMDEGTGSNNQQQRQPSSYPSNPGYSSGGSSGSTYGNFNSTNSNRTGPVGNQNNYTQSTQGSSRGMPSRNNTANNPSGIPNCNCGIPAAPLTVKKEGANKGRHFFGCSKNYSDPEKCNFFEWDDQGIGHAPPPGPSRGQQSTRGRGGNSHNGLGNMGTQYLSNRGGASNSNRGNKPKGAPRKCGNCKQTGHTRRNCPNLHGGGGDEDEVEYN